jgi:hypothetical protein
MWIRIQNPMFMKEPPCLSSVRLISFFFKLQDRGMGNGEGGGNSTPPSRPPPPFLPSLLLEALATIPYTEMVNGHSFYCIYTSSTGYSQNYKTVAAQNLQASRKNPGIIFGQSANRVTINMCTSYWIISLVA